MYARAYVGKCMRMRARVGVRAQARACACARVALLTGMQRACFLLSVVSLAPPCFSTLSNKRHDFRKKVTELEICCLIFSATFILNIFHSRKNSERHFYKYDVFVQNTHYSCRILMKLEFSRQIFEKNSNTIILSKSIH